MLRFVVSRLGNTVLTLVIAVTLAFLLGRLAGDPVANILGPLASAEEVAAERAALGLDQPLAVQFVTYFGQLLRGDLGVSLRYGAPNWDVIWGALPATLELAVAALIIAVVVGIPAGIVAALREGSWFDRLLMSLAILGQSLPVYWLGMMLVLLFAIQLHWLPAGQQGGIANLVLPAVTLATMPLAQVARLTRASVASVLRQDHVAAAAARGIRRSRVVVSHTLRNSALPVVTVIGLQLGGLLSGVVTVEAIFAWPGLGSLAISAVTFRDFSLVQAIVIVGAVMFSIINLVVDVSYGLIDPRIAEGQK